MAGPPPTARERRFDPVVLVLMGVAAVLFLSALGHGSIGSDELIPIRTATQPSWRAWWDEFQLREANPPLNHLIVLVWTKLFGTSDAVVRIPSALFGVASVGLVARLGRRLIARDVGRYAAYFVAISPFLLLFARTDIYYVPMLFFTLASANCLVEAFARSAAGEGAGRWWALYALTTALLLYTSYTAMAYVAIQGLFVAVLLRRGRSLLGGPLAPERRTNVLRHWALASAVAAAAFAAWLAVDIGDLFGREDSEGARIGVWGLSRLLLNGVYPLFTWGVGATLFPWHPLAVAATAAVAVAVVLGLRRLLRTGPPGAFVAACFVATFAVVVITFQVYVDFRPVETVPTRAISVFPFLLLTVAAGVAALGRVPRVAVLAVLTAASGLGAVNYFTGRDFHNPVYAVPGREIAADIERDLRPDDLIVAEDDIVIQRYLSEGAREQTALILTRNQGRDPEPAVLRRLERDEPGRVWLAVFGREGSRFFRAKSIESWLAGRYRSDEVLRYVPTDPTYRRVRERLQNATVYGHKVTVRLLVRRAEPAP